MDKCIVPALLIGLFMMTVGYAIGYSTGYKWAKEDSQEVSQCPKGPTGSNWETYGKAERVTRCRGH